MCFSVCAYVCVHVQRFMCARGCLCMCLVPGGPGWVWRLRPADETRDSSCLTAAYHRTGCHPNEISATRHLKGVGQKKKKTLHTKQNEGGATDGLSRRVSVSHCVLVD